ncbi:MAG: cytochrome c [Pseudomonadota bacterium]|nr:cytochrome c [Pseudomonadota bacterium]
MRWAALLLLLGCSARRTEPIAGPLVLDDEAARGERVFMQNCHSCHPFGEGGLGFSLNDKPLPGFMIRAQVRTGFGVMPGFDEQQIPREDLDALVVYLRRLRKHG